MPLSTKISQSVVTMESVPLFFLEKTFHIPKITVASFEKGSGIFDLSPLVKATTECVFLEDKLILQGTDNVPGLLTVPQTLRSSLHPWEELGQASLDIINAISLLDEAGFPGPYTLALPPSLYNLLLHRYPPGESTELAHIQKIVQDRVVKAPALKKGGILLQANENFVSIIVGQDLQIGLLGIDGEGFFFSVSESITLLIRKPQSVCILE